MHRKEASWSDATNEKQTVYMARKRVWYASTQFLVPLAITSSGSMNYKLHMGTITCLTWVQSQSQDSALPLVTITAICAGSLRGHPILSK